MTIGSIRRANAMRSSRGHRRACTTESRNLRLSAKIFRCRSSCSGVQAHGRERRLRLAASGPGTAASRPGPPRPARPSSHGGRAHVERQGDVGDRLEDVIDGRACRTPPAACCPAAGPACPPGRGSPARPGRSPPPWCRIVRAEGAVERHQRIGRAVLACCAGRPAPGRRRRRPRRMTSMRPRIVRRCPDRSQFTLDAMMRPFLYVTVSRSLAMRIARRHHCGGGPRSLSCP